LIYFGHPPPVSGMKTLVYFLLLIFTGRNTIAQMASKTYTYLALGDSYTIGEAVLLTENFPYQTAALLQQEQINLQTPEIVAKTGWTTDELQTAINQHHFRKQYDFITLLIGVNNQYRGRTATEYAEEFESLLKQAIAFAGNDASHVVVLSIPDWGVTPFAEASNREKIAAEIDAYNAVNREISKRYHIHYINITPGTREAATNNTLLAADGLHPSDKEYKRWAEKVKGYFLKIAQNHPN
jgi:lysophospholipase L1-like esterase